MKRSKKIVLLAHCLLNTNAKVDGISVEPACAKDLIMHLIENDYGMIQLPCVEMDMCGICRWGQVKNQLDHPHFRSRCKELLAPIVFQVEDYLANGYEVRAVIGADGSPSCGVNRTCKGDWYGEIGDAYHTMEKAATCEMVEGAGVMMDVLREMFIERNICVPFMALAEESMDMSALNI